MKPIPLPVSVSVTRKYTEKSDRSQVHYVPAEQQVPTILATQTALSALHSIVKVDNAQESPELSIQWQTKGAF